MKTVQEMRARYVEQVESHNAQTSKLAGEMAKKWIDYLSQRLDVVFELTYPNEYVVGYANAIDCTASADVIAEAILYVSAHFQSLGFDAYSCMSPGHSMNSAGQQGVKVAWVKSDDDE